MDKFISADSHLMEPPDLWATRMDRRLRDRAPRPQLIGGENFWTVDNTPIISMESPLLASTERKHRPAIERRAAIKHEDVRPGGLDAHLRLVDQDLDSIAAEVVYPNWALFFFSISDPEYQRQCIRVFNDYAAEFCSAEPKRLIGAGMLPLRGPIDWAIEEARHCARLGLRGVLITAGLPARPYLDPYYEPLWDALDDLDLLVGMHSGAREELFKRANEGMGDFWIVDQKMMVLQHGFTGLIAAAIPQRHPRLRFVMVEGGIGWIAPVLRLMDHWWEDHHEWIQPHLDETPSFYFKRQFWATFEDDRPGLMTRHLLNIDHLMWGSDYPHSEGTFPYSRQQIAKDFADIPAEETDKLVRRNAASLYGIDV
jgi:predicted TIM-barrel fold metal-dependent hydrolase